MAVRVRPAWDTEDVSEDIVLEGNQMVVRGKVSRFDSVLGPDVEQEEVYNKVVRAQVEQVISDGGCNSVVFAYGPTGTGKTYTMGSTGGRGEEGVTPSSGVIPRAVHQVLANRSKNQMVKLAFYEILKDESSTKPQVFDLLAPGGKKPILVRQDKNQEAIPSLTEVPLTSVSHAMWLVTTGTKLRATESTAVNSMSSRSHAVLVISVGSCGQNVRKLSLVDLAGSESATRTKTSGTRLAEGVGINQSLLHLGNVIRALAKRDSYIPHR